MKQKSKRNKEAKIESSWKKSAAFWESNESLEAMRSSRALDAIERRKLLGPGRTKLISVRVPEDDLNALREIAEKHNRKYQQLMIQAIERFLDEYSEAVGRSKRKKES